MLKKVLNNKTKIKHTTKNIITLLCFVIGPAIQNNVFQKFDHISSFDRTRFILSNRADALTSNSKKPKVATKFAPNIHIGHELSAIISFEAQKWRISQKNFDSTIPSEQISPINITMPGVGILFRYAYQLPISTHFGFFLGTTGGSVYADRSSPFFYNGASIILPTILIGFTATPFEVYRITLGIEYGAIWYPGMKLHTNLGKAKPLSPTLGGWDIYLDNLYFFSDNFGLSLSIGMRFVDNGCILSFVCSNANYLNSLKLKSSTVYGQIDAVFANL